MDPCEEGCGDAYRVEDLKMRRGLLGRRPRREARAGMRSEGRPM
jgi:hypothetical protein